MKRILFFCMMVLLAAQTDAAGQKVVHRNIGLDSLMKVMQGFCQGQVYYVPGANAASLNYTVDVSSPGVIDRIVGLLGKSGYTVSHYEGDVYVLQGIGLKEGLPAEYFKFPVQQEKDQLLLGTLKGTVNEASGGDKVYQIGDKDNVKRGERVYLSGYVRNYRTGEPVVGVTLYDNASKAIAESDQHGFYRIMLPVGDVELNVAGFSLEETILKLNVYNDDLLDVIVKEKVFALNEVVVTSEDYNKVKSVSMGVENLRISAIRKVPVVLGEADVVKVLLTLPGVKSVGEASNGFNVRGGAVDQNLVLFNGGTVYNPSHMFGLFSGFNPDVISDVELYKSSIPVNYGGRISSVLDVNTRQGNNKKVIASLSAGALTTKGHIEGPIGKKTTFIAGGRTTYSDWLLNLLPKDSEYKMGTASFYDITAGLTHNFNDKHSIHFNGYYSSDQFKFRVNTKYAYENMNGSVKWRSNFNTKHSMELVAGYDSYNYLTSDWTNEVKAYEMAFDISQVYGRLKMKYMPVSGHSITYGADFVSYGLMPGSYLPVGEGSLVIPEIMADETAKEGAVYVGDNWAVNDRLSVDYGVRYSMFKSNKFYSAPEIRLSGRYFINERLSVKAGFNSMRQYIHMLSNTVAVSPTDTWKLSDKDIAPQKGWQMAAGAYTNVLDDKVELSVEAYYKRMDNYLDFKSGSTLVMNSNVAEDVVGVKGKAYGLELMASKPLGKLNGWASYTWSRTRLKEVGDRGTSAINRGEWYNAAYDKPHELKIVANYKFTHRVILSVNLDYATGRPATVPVARYDYNDAVRLYYTLRNSHRIPDYFRTDIALNLEPTHRLKAFTHFSFTVGVYNATGRKNAYSIYYEGSATDVHGYKLSVFAAPIPYMNFNFRF
ncbi:MAG: TonB-dependent receptor [Bacteroidales bacterium]|nr:TonB-dependent receptor [Bacteroidales bacterium]